MSDFFIYRFNIIKKILLFLSYIKLFFIELFKFCSIFVIFLIPGKRKSLNQIVHREIIDFQKKANDSMDADFSWGYRLSSRICNYKLLLLFLIIAIFFALYFLCHKQDYESNIYENISSIQATLFALIIPIAVALHEFTIKDRGFKAERMNFILEATKARLAIYSSSIFLALIIILNFFHQSPSLDFASIIWIIFNIFLISYFLIISLELINPAFFYKLMKKFVLTESYMQEIKTHLKIKNYYELDNEFIKTGPHHSSRTINVQVQKYSPKSMILSDIYIGILKFVINSCEKRNKNHSVLIFPLSLGKEYRGQVDLCRIEGDGTPLTCVEKWAIRFAFKFSKQKIKKSTINSTKSLEILAKDVCQSIHQNDKEMFDAAFASMTELHGLFLELGETKNSEGKPSNYAKDMAKKSGLPLQEKWAFSYRDIFKESVSALPEHPHFFSRCCYMTSKSLIPSILQNPSLVGLNPVIQAQRVLWIHLNGWWEKSCEGQKTRASASGHLD